MPDKQSNEQADAGYCEGGEVFCATCGDPFPQARRNLGYRHCLKCGDKVAKQHRFTVMPAYSKGAYQLISPQDVAHTNPKR